MARPCSFISCVTSYKIHSYEVRIQESCKATPVLVPYDIPNADWYSRKIARRIVSLDVSIDANKFKSFE